MLFKPTPNRLIYLDKLLSRQMCVPGYTVTSCFWCCLVLSKVVMQKKWAGLAPEAQPGIEAAMSSC